MIKPETVLKWRLSLPSQGRRRVSQRDASERLMVPFRTYQRWEDQGCPTDAIALAMGAVLYDLPPYR